MGKCKIDGKFCDGASLICRLNPSETHPMYYDDTDGSLRDFCNRKCSNYKKED